MENTIKEIQKLLENESFEIKKAIILECAVKIGSDEWAEEVRKFLERLKKLKR